MDKDTSDMRQNPKETANIFSILFFWFVQTLIIWCIFCIYKKEGKKEERTKYFVPYDKDFDFCKKRKDFKKAEIFFSFLERRAFFKEKEFSS